MAVGRARSLELGRGAANHQPFEGARVEVEAARGELQLAGRDGVALLILRVEAEAGLARPQGVRSERPGGGLDEAAAGNLAGPRVEQHDLRRCGPDGARA